jgi:hypothetical protein
MSVAEFQRHWRGPHADAALHIPNLRAYVQNHAVLDEAGRPLLTYPGFDACAETSYDDLADMDAGFSSPAYQRDVRADEQLLIDTSTFFLLLCDRRTLDDRPAPPNAVKLMTFLRVHAAGSRDEVLDLLAGPYATHAREAGAVRHEQLIPSVDAHAGRQPMTCDVVDSIWFDTAAQAMDFVNGASAEPVDTLLAGKVFGRERLLATPHVVRELAQQDPV